MEASAADAVGAVVRETLLGALAVACALVAWWAIRTLKSVQDARVSDRSEFTAVLLAETRASRETAGEMVEALRDKTAATRELTAAVRDLERRVSDVHASVSGTIRDTMLASARRPSSGTGRPPRDG